MSRRQDDNIVEGEELLQEEVHTIENILTAEIKCILERNQTEKFLRSLLTRALILEELTGELIK